MSHISPESPEERARRERRGGIVSHLDRVGPGSRSHEVLRRAAVGVWSDGFIHAGNLAYLALMTLFPMVIVLAAVAHLFGHGPDTRAAVDGLLDTMPHSVAGLLEQPIADVIAARTGALLWLGAGVGLWTVVGFIETVRDILHRAYGSRSDRSFLHYRLRAIALIVLAMVLALASFSAQIFLTALEQFIYRWIPIAEDVAGWIGLSRLVPLGVLAGALYFLFYALTPSKYRKSSCPKWPGAIFTALWWAVVTLVLPQALSLLGGYDLTYGSLAGVIIALLFFWLVGLGLVFGAHLNAALAETPSLTVKDASTPS